MVKWNHPRRPSDGEPCYSLTMRYPIIWNIYCLWIQLFKNLGSFWLCSCLFFPLEYEATLLNDVSALNHPAPQAQATDSACPSKSKAKQRKSNSCCMFVWCPYNSPCAEIFTTTTNHISTTLEISCMVVRSVCGVHWPQNNVSDFPNTALWSQMWVSKKPVWVSDNVQ